MVSISIKAGRLSLGAIGDARAIPALQAMLSEKNCGIAKHYVVEAIQDIEAPPAEEPAIKTGPTPLDPAPAIWRPGNKKD